MSKFLIGHKKTQKTQKIEWLKRGEQLSTRLKPGAHRLHDPFPRPSILVRPSVIHFTLYSSLFTLYSFPSVPSTSAFELPPFPHPLLFPPACSRAAKPREQPFLVPPSKFMLPDPQHEPAAGLERAADETVAFAVAFQLRFPELPILHRHSAVRSAGVPEAAIDEDGELESGEYKVRFAENRLAAPPSGDPMAAEEGDHGHFRSAVSAAADFRHDLRTLGFREHVRHGRVRQIHVLLASFVASCNLLRMAKAAAVKWTREHSLIALNLYCKLPFGKLDKGNPIIIEAAAKMGRTANSLAMKLCNFASLDPVQRARGIRGLPGASRQDRAMWDEFQANIGTLGIESEELLHNLFTRDQTKDVDLLSRDAVRLTTPTGPTETQATVKVRRGQQFFRQSILNAYDVRCCISGIRVPQLLVASHIKPWGKFPAERLNPRNGLCLSKLHDAAFDCGLITLDAEYKVVLSGRLKRGFRQQPALEENFAPFAGVPIQIPDKLAEPDAEFLAYHRESVFAM